MCVYTFIAGPQQRVVLRFELFNLRGVPPECNHEYIDLYSEVPNTDNIEVINTPFGGRFCGFIPPRSRISLYRTIVFTFYTDKNYTSHDLFDGVYSFVNNTEYQVGTAVPNSVCSYTINAVAGRKGTLLSPTYPGSYPKPLYCSYLFLGKVGQRVHLEFRDFDLFSGGPHCPFDVITIYDGRDNSSNVIGRYCGQHRNLIIYSTEENLFVTFETIQRSANTQNRGFRGMFEFSEGFVKLDFIGKNGGEHIRGTECDQKILSKKESVGMVYSPNYPFPYIPKTICRYFIYGLQDSQNLERVRLEFLYFQIPKAAPDKEDCGDRYLKIYLRGQEQTESYDKFDYELCGENIDASLISPMVSDGPRLVLIFSSGDSQGRGFKARYSFETEYLIPGTPSPDGGCHFSYRSVRRSGEVNSPRYPSNYPSTTNCTYEFLTAPNEQVSIIFEQFKVRADNANVTVARYGNEICQEDWLEIYNSFRNNTMTKVGRYCGLTSPGPIESLRGSIGIMLFFYTNEKDVYSGFRARYTFEQSKSIFGDCGSNITGSIDGVIQSSNFPIKYEKPELGISIRACNWYITVNPLSKVLLDFSMFILEGDPISRGCSAAVVRLWSDDDDVPYELCGEKPVNTSMKFISTNNKMRISFLVADKSAGAEGFKAIWTEVNDTLSNCTGFICSKSRYCISYKLRCNNISNCGSDDDSDELNCFEEAHRDWMVSAVTGGICVICIASLMVCFACQRKTQQRRHSRMSRFPTGSLHSSYTGTQHVCDELGQRFASVDSV